MFRTYPLGTTGPRRPESLHQILRRVERELAADTERQARRVAARPALVRRLPF